MTYYYLVAPAAIVRSEDHAFTYSHPSLLAEGTLVRVSVGKKMLNGVIVSQVTHKPAFAVKPIQTIVSPFPLPPPLLKLAMWLSDYYAAHLGSVLQTMLPTGFHKRRRHPASLFHHPVRKRTSFVLNKEQSSVLDTILHATGTVLLHGITGSGKTAVYIEAIKEQLSHNRSSIILVPEIGLTPQLVAELANHFQNLIVTHSRMTEAQRHGVWQEVLAHNDTPSVVIGPRSALFMPVQRLGLIIIDECHEPSYKQEQTPKYSALRAATMLAGFHRQACVVLGSATPGIVDYYIAGHTKSPLIRLTKPAVKNAPATVDVVDLKNKDVFRRHRLFSDPLLERIEETLAAGRQTLIFHNRRGTAPAAMCDNCGWLAECPTCFLPLTLHADSHILRCHICNYQLPVPPGCPVCTEPTIIFKGVGTKMIETEITKLFPKAAIARFDADNTLTDTIHHKYQQVYDGTINIIIGTQMIAKGLDLPRLSLVGVVQADSGLLLPDYQADERVFQLLYQVIGRVGRSHLPAHAVIQTFRPDHPVIRAAVSRDYVAFYNAELQKRRSGRFPPFRFLLKLTCVYKTERGAVQASQNMMKDLKSAHSHMEICGPTPAFHERLGGQYRWQLLIKSQTRAPLVRIAARLPSGWQADLDPASLL